MAKLTFVLDDGQAIEVPLPERFTLGRGEDNDVVVDDDRISKRHAELVRNADGSIQVFDSDSSAGTFVNGERVRSHTIRHGDRLAFGPLTAVLNLDEHATNGKVVAPEAILKAANGKPVKADKIATSKKDRTAKKNASKTALQSGEAPARSNAIQQDAAHLIAEKTRLHAEVEAAENELRGWQERAEKDHDMHDTRMESLRAEVERLASMKAASQEAETTHGELLKSIQILATEHAEKAADLKQLNAGATAVRQELQSLATQRDKEHARLQQIRAECEKFEAALDEKRRQIAELEERSQESRVLAEAREDQVNSAEKKFQQFSQRRTQIEAHIKELSGTEERLLQALGRCQQAESQHAVLTAAIASLGQEQLRSEAALKEFESRIRVLQEHHQQATTAADAARTAQQHTEKSLRRVQDELSAKMKDLSACSDELATETQRMEAAKARRAEIELQCQELATTTQQLAEVKQQLASAEKQLVEANTAVAEGEAQIDTHRASVKGLEEIECAAKRRIEALDQREKDLRAELTSLTASERSERAHFEEVRQLAAEAEKEHAARQKELAASLDATRRDLADIVSRLTPLREWKEAMDLLYARLATLPQDSPEARELWHEIEKEKADLHSLIVTARTQARGVSLREAVRHSGGTASGHLPNEPRSAIGASQESTLRSRLNHLRESVQHEEARLESLRKDRSREESRPRSGGPAAGAMLREQNRQLEAKIRQEEERHATLLRNLEVSGMEEEKRREKITEMERKLAELRADIAEAERQRSELRQQADLAHTELKNYEAALDRVIKNTSDPDGIALSQMPG